MNDDSGFGEIARYLVVNSHSEEVNLVGSDLLGKKRTTVGGELGWHFFEVWNGITYKWVTETPSIYLNLELLFGVKF